MAGKQKEKHRFAREVKRKGKEGARLKATHPGDTKFNEITYRMHTRLPPLPLCSEKDCIWELFIAKNSFSFLFFF